MNYLRSVKEEKTEMETNKDESKMLAIFFGRNGYLIKNENENACF